MEAKAARAEKKRKERKKITNDLASCVNSAMRYACVRGSASSILCVCFWLAPERKVRLVFVVLVLGGYGSTWYRYVFANDGSKSIVYTTQVLFYFHTHRVQRDMHVVSRRQLFNIFHVTREHIQHFHNTNSSTHTQHISYVLYFFFDVISSIAYHGMIFKCHIIWRSESMSKRKKIKLLVHIQ